MAEKQRKGHPAVRKAVFSVLALMLVVVMGRVAVEAFSFISGNSGAVIEINGEKYTITGESCYPEEDMSGCCMEACIVWCGEKKMSAERVAVFNQKPFKCECTCID